MSLRTSLEQIESSLSALGRSVVRRFRPPLDVTTIEQLWHRLPFARPLELDVLYGWHDGTETREDDVLDELNFLPGFYFPSLEEAVRIYRERADSEQWHDGWFPILADGAGDFYLVPCAAQPVASVPVIGFIHGEPEQPIEYLSMTSMMETVARAYAERAYFVDADGTLEIDDAKLRAIAMQTNPGISLWEE